MPVPARGDADVEPMQEAVRKRAVDNGDGSYSCGYRISDHKDLYAAAVMPRRRLRVSVLVNGAGPDCCGLTVLAAVHIIVDLRCWLPFILRARKRYTAHASGAVNPQ